MTEAKLITELAAFEGAARDLWQAHCHHVAIFAGVAEAPAAQRSRRCLYNALKAYRQAETALFHRIAAETGSGEAATAPAPNR